MSTRGFSTMRGSRRTTSGLRAATLRRIALVGIGLLLTNGCASSRNGDAQLVEFRALPAGTTVRVEPGRDEAIPTPSTLRLYPARSYRVRFEKPGYEPQTVVLDSRLKIHGNATTGSQDLMLSGGDGWSLLASVGLVLGRMAWNANDGNGRELVPGAVAVTLVPLRTINGQLSPGWPEARPAAPDGASELSAESRH